MSIATLKQLAAQATAGPWRKDSAIGNFTHVAIETITANRYLVADCVGSRKSDNAELIAAMRNNIDALIAVAEAAQNMVGVMECDDDLSQAFCCPDGCCFKALRAALARLEA